MPWVAGLLLAAIPSIGCASSPAKQGAGDAAFSARIVAFPTPTGARARAVPVAAVKLPEREAYPAVLYLDGSGCRSVVHLMQYFQALVQRGYAVVAPEKRGVAVADDGTACSREFLEHDTRPEREEAARTVASRLKEVLPGWNHEVVIIAASEGAAFAPAVAQGVPELRGLALLGGGGWTQARALVAKEEARLSEAGATEQERLEARSRIRGQMDAILRQPRSPATWLGHPYGRWASYLDYDPMPHLLAVKAPLFMANGANDRVVPIESARAVKQAFEAAKKPNLTSREYGGLDHRWFDADGRSHFVEVARDLLDWLRSVAPVSRS